MRLVLEQQLDVAGDALGELRRSFERPVERRDLQRVHPADGSRHGLGRTAQHVDIGVVDRLVPARSLSVDHHLASAVLFRIITLDDVGPQHACGAQLGDFEEVVGRNAEREAQLACGLVDRQPGIHQTHEVVVPGRESESQLLDDGGTRVAENLRRDAHNADMLVLLGFADQLDNAGEALLAVGRAEVTLGRKALDQRVDAKHDVRILLGQALLFDFRQHEVGDMAHLLAAEHEVDGRQVDVAQQHVEIGGRELGLGHVEAERIDARTEQLQRFGIGRRRIGDGYRLVDAPTVVRMRTAHVGEFACLRTQKPQPFEVFSAVVRTDVESLARTPHQLAFVVSTFQVSRNHLFPLRGRHRGKFGEQLFLFGICHNYL